MNSNKEKRTQETPEIIDFKRFSDGLGGVRQLVK